MGSFRSSLAGMFLMLAGSPATAADAPTRQDIQVTLSNFNFAPNMLRMQRNMSYAIHLVNSASGGHSFSAPGFFAAVAVAPEDRSKIVNGKVDIPAGRPSISRSLP